MKDTLIKIGLSPEEVELYLSLLEKGAQSAAQLASSTSVKRTYVYRVASSLANKGLVTEAKHGRATVFEPNSPDHLLSLAEAKKIEAEQARANIEGVLDALKLKYSLVESKPIVRLYEGYSGLKKVFMDTLSEKKDISALLQVTDVEPKFKDWLKSTYSLTRAKENIHARVILASGDMSQEYISRNKQSNREVKLIPVKDYPLSLEVDIYGNKVAFIDYKDVDKPVGLIIEHKDIAKTLQAWFELAWSKLK